MTTAATTTLARQFQAAIDRYSKFDESQVNRDEQGQFATKEGQGSASEPKPQPRKPSRIEENYTPAGRAWPEFPADESDRDFEEKIQKHDEETRGLLANLHGKRKAEQLRRAAREILESDFGITDEEQIAEATDWLDDADVLRELLDEEMIGNMPDLYDYLDFDEDGIEPAKIRKAEYWQDLKDYSKQLMQDLESKPLDKPNRKWLKSELKDAVRDMGIGREDYSLARQFDRAIARYTKDEKWITIGGEKEGDKNHVGGTPVKIDGQGNIKAGPAALAEKGIKNLKDFGGGEKKKTATAPQPKSNGGKGGKIPTTAEKKPTPKPQSATTADDSDSGFSLKRESNKTRKKAEFDDSGKGKQGGLFDTGKNDIKGQNLMFDDHYNPAEAMEDAKRRKENKGKSVLDLPTKEEKAKSLPEKIQPISNYEKGGLIPAELYDGLWKRNDPESGFKVRVEKDKQGKYNVWLDGGNGLKSPYATGVDSDSARNAAWRAAGFQPSDQPTAMGQIISNQKKLVESAIKNGEKVPDEVLADFPSLKPKSPYSRLTAEFDRAFYARMTPKARYACQWITLSAKNNQGDKSGGAKICIGDGGKIEKGPKALKRKKISSIVGPQSAVDEAIRDGARRHGVTKAKLKAAVEDVLKEKREIAKEREEMKQLARQWVGMTPGEVEKLKNKYLDYDSIPGFDDAASELVNSHPELGIHPDDASEGVWELIQEPRENLPKKTDPDIIQEAAERLRAGDSFGPVEVPSDEDYVPFSRMRQAFDREFYRRGFRVPIDRETLVDRFNRAFAVHMPQVARYAERWITIGGNQEGDKKHAGGTPVKIDDDGNIKAGPAGLAAKGIKNLNDFGKNPQSADNSIRQTADNSDNGGQSKGKGPEQETGERKTRGIGMRPSQEQLKEVSQVLFGKKVGDGHIWKAIGDHYGKPESWAIRHATKNDIEVMLDSIRRKSFRSDLKKLSDSAIATAQDEYMASANEIVDLVRNGDKSDWWNDWDIELNDDEFAKELRKLHR